MTSTQILNQNLQKPHFDFLLIYLVFKLDSSLSLFIFFLNSKTKQKKNALDIVKEEVKNLPIIFLDNSEKTKIVINKLVTL